MSLMLHGSSPEDEPTVKRAADNYKNAVSVFFGHESQEGFSVGSPT